MHGIANLSSRHTKSVERQIKNAESPRSNITIRKSIGTIAKKAAKLTFTDATSTSEDARNITVTTIASAAGTFEEEKRLSIRLAAECLRV